MPKKRIDRNVNIDDASVTFTHVESKATVVAEYNKLSDAMKLRVGLHGLNAKVGDSAASLSVDAVVVMQEVLDGLYADDWGRGRGAGDGVGRSTDLHEALAQLYPDKTSEEVAAVIAKKSKEDRATLKKHPTIVSIIEDIKKKRQDAKTKAAKSAATETEDALDLDFG